MAKSGIGGTRVVEHQSFAVAFAQILEFEKRLVEVVESLLAVTHIGPGSAQVVERAGFTIDAGSGLEARGRRGLCRGRAGWCVLGGGRNRRSSGRRAIDFVPDGERLIQIFQCVVVLSEVVIDFADVVERLGFACARWKRTPERQRLIEQAQSAVFLTKIGVDAAHGVQGRGLAEQARILLLDGQRLIEIIKPFFELT